MSNQIKGVEVDGVWKEDPITVRFVVRSLFKNAFLNLIITRLDLGTLTSLKLLRRKILSCQQR